METLHNFHFIDPVNLLRLNELTILLDCCFLFFPINRMLLSYMLWWTLRTAKFIALTSYVFSSSLAFSILTKIYIFEFRYY